MRLTQTEVNSLVLAITPFLQERNAELRLYGSRVNDNLKGGDLDLLLLVENTDVAHILQLQKHNLLAAMKKHLGERKIDLKVATHASIASDTFLTLIFPESMILHTWHDEKIAKK